MGFVFGKSKRWRVPMAKTTGKNAALARLRSFLDAQEPQTVSWLVSTWNSQQNSITYRELREAILSGGMTPSQLNRWQQDYAELVNTKLAPQWTETMAAAAAERQAQFRFLYDPAVGAAQAFVRQRGAELVTNMVTDQQNALRAMTLQATRHDAAMTVDSLARVMRPVIGLTRPQAIANLNHYNTVKTGLLKANPNMREATAERRARDAAARYAARQHRYRAQMIARTELAAAYNQGVFFATEDARDKGYLGDCRKVWLTAADERVCAECGPLDGKAVNMNAFFPNGVKLPPAHPNCRCAVAFEEAAENLTPGADGGIMDAAGGNAMRDTEDIWDFAAGLDEDAKIRFFGGKTKAALFDAGLLAPEDYFKPLRDIDLSGIVLPDRAAMKHATVGDYVEPSRLFPNGRLKGGGHTVAAMEEMDRHGIAYNVVRTAPNGVMFGNVPSSPLKIKQIGNGQTWFPRNWTEHDIRSAGIYVANKGVLLDNGYSREAIYKGVNVRVNMERGARIGTVCPSLDQL